MEYAQSLEASQSDGFRWQLLRKHFPFGAVALRKAYYQRMVTARLVFLPIEVDRERLLDLLDMQAVTFPEQCWGK